ncbi:MULTISPECIES: decaprenyl-phosphate phosphoribosyltransferase [Chloracidobacterium]|jgi:4-hydroxybenzoate polyprenyltransferase|uniref:4-hydroxybenzoate polyprenyltransferase-like prenyltransferase n=1 Tax=Chloracidobacterium thermophilum (strain B) TaxID=981222 RepID=G2LHB0_CHLTF|nr:MULTISPECIES: decaprenyl-phosphate phosphoribosyltransferase [Chloracidobacterium]AEP12173.1 4-hydroxybenzoate polyprenyltransferase-like prenyltransferase [Chloracidobacterium thermophilum B]QUV77914.1 decaprenyl-phosphate phosphoribosyltransferase [Chloracidobacterium thermophilum]QUV80972.1 decaprenyl-phosphate phosphoribosyltransferase [Chloracidobacterium sp. D]
MPTAVVSFGLTLPLALLKAMRPQQWTKNVLLFPALLFSQNLFHWRETVLVCAACAVFCLLSSGVYLLNDLLDIESDRAHPLKRHRPLASGALPVPVGIAACAFLSAGALAAAFWLSTPFAWTAVAYFLLQVAYTVRLKHVVILDVGCIAAGFVLRAVAGGQVIAVTISAWLLICAMLLSLFLALGKRRHELLLLEDGATAHRRILGEYTPDLLDQMISVVTAATVVCYTFYTVAPETVAKFGTTRLVFTVPFVLYGIFRYLYLIHRRQMGGSPEKALLNDGASLVNLVLYGLAVVAILYWLR